ARSILPQLAPGHAATRILVVDDLEDNRNYLQELLAAAGFEVRTAASGAESLAACAEWNPHLVLMDTRMPGMDGLETIRRLRAVPAYAALKIITVSASTYLEDQTATRLAGADEFVAKPVLPQELLEKIRHLLGLTFARPPAAAPAQPARADLVALLAAQPESWRHHLRDHLLLADFIRVKAAINILLPGHPAAAQSLLHLAARFDADGLLQLLADAVPSFSN
ncbi:MAG: response regulator, partial [Verrucomicrobiota bacterium]